MNKTMEAAAKQGSRNRSFGQYNASGFTLIELIIVIVIVAIGVALAVPSYRDTVEKRRLTSSAEQIFTLFSFAQSAAVKHNSDVVVNLRHTDHDTWCIGATLGPVACNCFVTESTNDAFCDIEGVARRLDQTAVLPNTTYDLLHQMRINNTVIADDNIVFDPVRGTLVGLDEINIRLHTHQGSDGTAGSRSYQLEVNAVPSGRASICTVNADSHPSDTSYVKNLLQRYSTCLR
jgi:prepilin-type N-terminal cleavage/methylation domain-containing protein